MNWIAQAIKHLNKNLKSLTLVLKDNNLAQNPENLKQFENVIV